MQFTVSDIYIEHTCCWTASIIKTVENGKGIYGEDQNIEVVLECRLEDSRMICEALNKYWAKAEVGE